MNNPAVWLPTVRTNTGTDIFTERLATGLQHRGIKAQITWLPHYAEYFPLILAKPAKPDWANVIHTNSWLRSNLLLENVPLIVTVHHTVHRADSKRAKGFFRGIYHKYWIAPNERRMLHRADCVTAVSQFVADATVDDLVNVPIQVIYNGVDTNRFRPSKRTQGKPFRLLYVGGWSRRKGVDLLEPIMQKLGPDFELLYTGPEAGRTDGNMQDIGALLDEKDVIDAMQDADALLFPTRSEGFGLVAIEAMASGLPVVTSEICPLNEILENGVTGFLCMPNNPDSFVDTIRKLKANDKLYENVRSAARLHAVQNFSMDAMIDAYIRLYQQIIVNYSNEPDFYDATS